MGLLNVYQMRTMRPYINYRFKCNIWPFDGGFVNSNPYYEYTIKKVKLPTFKLNTENKISFGNTAFVIPIIDFGDTSLDITFEEDDVMNVFELLCGFYGKDTYKSAKMQLICVKIDQFDETMINLVDSKLYLCRMKEFSQPSFNNNGRGAPVEITASFNVVYIYQGDASESGFDYNYKSDSITRPEDENEKYFEEEMKKQSKTAEELYKKKEEKQKQIMLKYVQAGYEKYKPKALEKLKEKKTEESKKIISENTDLLKTYASGYSILKDGVDYSKSDAKYAGNDLLLFSEMFNVDLSDGVDDNERTRIKEGIASTRKNFVKRLKDEGKSDAEIKEFFENDTGIFVNKVLSNEAAENIVNIAVAYSQAQQNIDLLNNTENAVDLEANLKTIYGNNFDDVLLREEMNLDLEASKTPDLGHTAPGKQLEATGAYGVENITKEKLMGVAKAEFLGTNKAGRPEGPVDLAYMNYHDGGAQKGNFGMGNTQKYLENIGLGSEKFTLINTTNKKTYTGTLQELTDVMKSAGDCANSTASVWRLDEKSAKRIEQVSMGHVADAMMKSIDPEILGAMDYVTLGGVAHIEYGSGGSLTRLGSYLNEHKKEVIEELKRNNGQFSDEFVNEMMKDRRVRNSLYVEWTVKEGVHKGERNYADRRGRLTGKYGYGHGHL